MKKGMMKRNSGLLPLGLVISLAATLCSFEYISADIKYGENVGTSKMDEFEIEHVDEPEIIRPKTPSQQQAEQPRTTVSTPVVTPVTPTVFVPTTTPVDPNPPVVIGDPGPISDPIYGPEEPELEDTFVIVEDMPTFEKFLTIKDKVKREQVTQKEIMTIIMSNVKYPQIAREMGIQGKVSVEFIVSKDGTIKDIKIARGVSLELDQEALKGVGKIPTMIPGKQRGKEVNVKFIVPVTFKLD